jgi:hypothetical protein
MWSSHNVRCPLGPGLREPQNCAKGWHLDDRNTCQPNDPSNPALGYAANLPKCDGSYQDCITESGHVCEAGSGEHECEEMTRLQNQI